MTNSNSNQTFYRPALVDGRWHTKNCNTGVIGGAVSFPKEYPELSEMLNANLMGRRVHEARVLWDLMDEEVS